ncbi:hypothetical protein FAGAP_12085 [Fusarium agapanthi]|uniref:Major facilitator superfamily (MFS) profile domain-containing protein n=1 Tax=Fusarium agapanthi TaxID=1803897 RepID=A0A9P5E368_9HYPO|nr:hypothetical protein FAGAP_12085 [Fusarium agapanthi]
MLGNKSFTVNGAACEAEALPLACPESPRWLAMREDWDGVMASLARLRGMMSDVKKPIVEDNIQEMRILLEEERKVGQGSWLECFGVRNKGPKVLYRTLLGMAVQFFQQWTGANYFFYYGATIFESAGIDDPILVQLILGAINVGMTFFGIYYAERFGRRWPLIIGGLWQTAWLLIFASASLATASNWLANFLISFLTPFADAGISYAFGCVFAGMNLIGTVIVYFFL